VVDRLEVQQSQPPVSLEDHTGPIEPPHFARGTANPPLVDITAVLSDLEAKLSRCLASLAMHFQPIVYAHDRARFGYEALLRSADRSLPHPGAILDAAERLEKIPMLGRAVRAQTAGTAKPGKSGDPCDGGN
jgi:EAL domain-containing protein (putative c-di-GMP-specific phosphodiesterase class I)